MKSWQNKLICFIILIILYYYFNQRYTKILNIVKNQSKIDYSSSANIKRNQIKGCIIALVKETNIVEFTNTIKQIERQFNSKYNYPYILFNNEEFTDNFKLEIRKHTTSLVEFGVINKNEWSIPKWINETKLNKSLDTIKFSINYRHMCRFYSGFFFKHELTLKYDYYIRIDTDSIFPCEFNYNPFYKLIENNIKYGFILTNREGRFTIPTLWQTIKQWSNLNNLSFNNNRLLKFISNDNGSTLSFDDCIFYNNFEISSFSVFRNKLYLDYFDYLDKSGGFYYERWGDAPVHTYYMILTLNHTDIYRFKEIGYGHQYHYNLPEDHPKSCPNFTANINYNICYKLWDSVK